MALKRLSGRKLQATRERIWAVNPHCVMCGGLTDLTQGPNGFELDHIIAVSKDDSSNEDSNLQVLCYPCHEKKTAADLGYTPKAATGDDGWPVEQTPQQMRAARWRRVAGKTPIPRKNV